MKNKKVNVITNEHIVDLNNLEEYSGEEGRNRFYFKDSQIIYKDFPVVFEDKFNKIEIDKNGEIKAINKILNMKPRRLSFKLLKQVMETSAEIKLERRRK